MPTIAVTGATGNLGGLVIDHLLTAGTSPEDVVPLVRSEAKGVPFRARGMAPRVASYEDPEGFLAALTGIDKLVLISPPVLVNAERLQLLYDAVMAVHASDVEQLAFVSLADPEERPFRLEDIEMAIEHSIRALDIPFTFLRNSVYFDELTPELTVAAATGSLLSITGNHPMNWAARADQAAAIAAAVSQDGHLGKTYNLVAAEPYTYDDVAAWLTVAAGRPVVHRPAPQDDVVKSLTDGGMDAAHASSMVGDFQAAIAAGKCHTTGGDIAFLSGRSGQPDAETVRALLTREQDR